MSLALYALQLYEDDFNIETWKFLKPKLKNIKSWDQIDAVSLFIIGKILLKYPRFEKEIFKLSKSRDFWLRRIAIVSTLPRIKKGDILGKIARRYNTSVKTIMRSNGIKNDRLLMPGKLLIIKPGKKYYRK